MGEQAASAALAPGQGWSRSHYPPTAASGPCPYLPQVPATPAASALPLTLSPAAQALSALQAGALSRSLC